MTRLHGKGRVSALLSFTFTPCSASWSRPMWVDRLIHTLCERAHKQQLHLSVVTQRMFRWHLSKSFLHSVRSSHYMWRSHLHLLCHLVHLARLNECIHVSTFTLTRMIGAIYLRPRWSERKRNHLSYLTNKITHMHSSRGVSIAPQLSAVWDEWEKMKSPELLQVYTGHTGTQREERKKEMYYSRIKGASKLISFGSRSPFFIVSYESLEDLRIDLSTE